MSTTKDIKGTKVYIEGEGEHTIVMLHGWPDTHEIWQHQVAFFKSAYKCVTFTLPGFAKEDPSNYSLDDIISKIELIIQTISPDKKVILLLHDWGCIFGYEYAIRNSDKIEKMIAIDIGDASSKEFQESLSIKAKLMLFSYQITLALAWKLGSNVGNIITKGMAKGLQARSNMDNVHVGMDFPYAMRWLGSNGGMNSLQTIHPKFPFFYTYALKKPFLFHSESWIKEIKSNPSNKVQSFDCGHWVMVDKAKEFNTSIKEWLEN
jgi:pimeloyl-ACP methyl ester carboxylesterase